MEILDDEKEFERYKSRPWRAPDFVFMAVAHAIDSANTSNIVNVFRASQNLSITRLGKNYQITPLWAQKKWLYRDENWNTVCSPVSTSSHNVSEILGWINEVCPELGLGITTFRPSKVYPAGEQQELCL